MNFKRHLADTQKPTYIFNKYNGNLTVENYSKYNNEFIMKIFNLLLISIGK